MNEEERCNITLGLGTAGGVGMKKEIKQSKNNINKRALWLDLSLMPLHPKSEASDDDQDHLHHHKINDDEIKDDQDSFSIRTIDDQEKEEEDHRIRVKRSTSNANGYNNCDGSRKKLKLTTEQTTLLEDSFKIHSTLNTGQKQDLAKKLNLLPRQIEVWFQNRRARTKLKQIEQECELLKKCCETLTEENRRLKKERQEVRSCSLKFDHHHHQQTSLPFYIRPQYPTTSASHQHRDMIGKIGEETKAVATSGGSMGQMHHDHINNNRKNA